jgi:hypothetical protein
MQRGGLTTLHYHYLLLIFETAIAKGSRIVVDLVKDPALPLTDPSSTDRSMGEGNTTRRFNNAPLPLFNFHAAIEPG